MGLWDNDYNNHIIIMDLYIPYIMELRIHLASANPLIIGISIMDFYGIHRNLYGFMNSYGISRIVIGYVIDY